MYTVIDFPLNEINCDENGAHINTQKIKSYYYVENEQPHIIKSQTAYSNNSKFWIKEKRNRNYLNVSLTDDNVCILERKH